ncbi:MAG: glycosyltransferase family 2 protein [Polaribacter sp.]|nr:glycosyltransferase family 2 protein [Polaribacter sp.]MDG1953352.1 glycosyltransferase family 2 protein [Polaribacter sp.]MDG1993156.1 glycosyltransferase family 2 protein [Polaribacter sp.]
MKITAIIPTLNEEIHIENAIRSVDFADEIIVIDSFSTDQTIALAEKHNVKILQRVFDDFSTQKNYAIDLAKNDWIYILDADERVTQLLKEEILSNHIAQSDCVGFYVKRTFYFLEKKIKYSGWQRDKVVRLFHRKFCRYNGVPVHELIESNGKLGFLKGKVDHFSYRDFDHYISKLNQYAGLQAQNLYQQNKKVTAYHLFIKPPIRFFIHYIIRLGFLDGFAGFLIAKTQAYAVMTRYIKLWLLNNKRK